VADQNEKLTPAEELAKQRVEAAVRAEYEKRYSAERQEEIARAKLALSIVAFLVACVGIPLVGLAIGLAVRGFRWAAGF
jgi:hypothetical protein